MFTGAPPRRPRFNWLFGILISQFVPVLQTTIGFSLFYVFAVSCVFMAAFWWEHNDTMCGAFLVLF